MKVLNFGSLNVDYVYKLPHVVMKGETISSTFMNTYPGGKGLNQSIALGKAGAEVYHAGAIGEDGKFLVDFLKESGVNTKFVKIFSDIKSGHAIIQNDDEGDNCILLYGGANQAITKEQVDETMAEFSSGDYLVLQNEINQLDYIIEKAYERGMKIVLNPSPFDEKLKSCDLNKIHLFMINEIEGGQITGCSDKDEILEELAKKFPHAQFVLTLGSDGAVYYDGKEKVFQDIFKVKAVDTTAAGDTFSGFFLAKIIEGAGVAEALRTAAKASSIAVSRPGAAPSIPTMEEVVEGLKG